MPSGNGARRTGRCSTGLACRALFIRVRLDHQRRQSRRSGWLGRAPAFRDVGVGDHMGGIRRTGPLGFIVRLQDSEGVRFRSPHLRKGVQFRSPHLGRCTMTAGDREKFLPLALRVVGVIFMFGIYPLSVVWPSGWAWAKRAIRVPRNVDRRHLRDSRPVLVPSGTQSSPPSELDLIRHLVKRRARVGHGGPVRSRSDAYPSPLRRCPCLVSCRRGARVPGT